MTTETLPVRAPAEPTTPIRPSEALRLGRLLFPRQIFIAAIERPDGACSWAAAAYGSGWPDSGGPAWGNERYDCPAGRRFFGLIQECRQRDAEVSVVHLNDHHRWPSAQIVAWLESLGL